MQDESCTALICPVHHTRPIRCEHLTIDPHASTHEQSFAVGSGKAPNTSTGKNPKKCLPWADLGNAQLAGAPAGLCLPTQRAILSLGIVRVWHPLDRGAFLQGQARGFLE